MPVDPEVLKKLASASRISMKGAYKGKVHLHRVIMASFVTPWYTLVSHGIFITYVEMSPRNKMSIWQQKVRLFYSTRETGWTPNLSTPFAAHLNLK